MDLGRFLVQAVVMGGASPTELARSHPISRSWLFRLLARYRAGGYDALKPKSKRPKSNSRQTPAETERAIVELRGELAAAGFDAGPQTIAHHLRERFGSSPSRPTIWRILKRHGLITRVQRGLCEFETGHWRWSKSPPESSRVLAAKLQNCC